MKKIFQLKGADPVFFISHLTVIIVSYSIYLAPHIAPSTFPYFGFIPIFYPFIVLFNVILVLILLSRRIFYAILFAILTLGLFPPLAKTYQFFGQKMQTEADFKVISFNAEYFRKDGFVDFFKKENADLILLQEAYWRDDLHRNLKDSILGEYFHEKHGLIQVFSKYPIVEFQRILSEGNGNVGTAAYADIDIGHDTIRIINVYLESMFIEKKLVKESMESIENAKNNSKILKNKLTKGFLTHESQIKKLVPYILNSKHPVILAGDLNSVPNSYEYQQISYLLNDAYYQIGRSSGTSFHDFKFPLRLDYIFHSEEILPIDYKVLRDVKLSGHYPVVGQFKLPE